MRIIRKGMVQGRSLGGREPDTHRGRLVVGFFWFLSLSIHFKTACSWRWVQISSWDSDLPLFSLEVRQQLRS